MLWRDHPADQKGCSPLGSLLPIAPRTGAQVTSRKDIAQFALLQRSVLLRVNELQMSSSGHENMSATVSDEDAHAVMGRTFAVMRELAVAIQS